MVTPATLVDNWGKEVGRGAPADAFEQSQGYGAVFEPVRMRSALAAHARGQSRFCVILHVRR